MLIAANAVMVRQAHHEGAGEAAEFDRLTMRAHGRGRRAPTPAKAPHPEPVEGRGASRASLIAANAVMVRYAHNEGAGEAAERPRRPKRLILSLSKDEARHARR